MVSSVTSLLRAGLVLLTVGFAACGKSGGGEQPPTPNPRQVAAGAVVVDGVQIIGDTLFNVATSPQLRVSFNEPLDKTSLTDAVRFTIAGQNTTIPVSTTLSNNDSVMTVTFSQPLVHLQWYQFSLNGGIKSASGGRFISTVNKKLLTRIDSAAKFPMLSDADLLTRVQEQTFRYFWDFGHPVSGLARERNSSGDVVTTGGSGFGVLCLLVGVERNFITRQQALDRVATIVDFLENKAIRYHGAFSHWLNGATGLTVPFSEKDNGADLVETSFLMMGLLSARQYFDGADAQEASLRASITELYDAVEWNWFLKDGGDVLYWHWSPTFGWDVNLPIRGWNESLVTYVLAAGSKNYSIPKAVYDNGWARAGAIRNGNTYYGFPLPLGEAFGGPLFLAHYSFLGIDPRQLKDAYAEYDLQNKQHTLINRQHSIENPGKYFGYSSQVWGLTASDIPGGYTASSPSNDRGVIAPTAAISSFPYIPQESMQALKFYYYVLGDKLFGDYGFKDAFSLHRAWFADSYLAIDQGPIIVMIENHRTGLIWNLFSRAGEVKRGLEKLGFTAPYL